MGSEMCIRDSRKVSYNFAKNFFEYANGYAPSLKQRLDLYAMIPAEAQACRMKDLLREVLVYSLEGEAK